MRKKPTISPVDCRARLRACSLKRARRGVKFSFTGKAKSHPVALFKEHDNHKEKGRD
jgi:hypothetical protein